MLIFMLVFGTPEHKAYDKDITPIIHTVFEKAEIPQELWDDFAAVAACESEFDAFALGDNGNAKGLFQIHWYLWAPWAGMEYDNPFDPVHNARLAYLIGEEYSVPRGVDRWDQWSAKPFWSACEEMRDELIHEEVLLYQRQQN